MLVEAAKMLRRQKAMKRIKMPHVLIVADKVILKGIVNRAFLEAIFFLSIIQT